MKTRLAKILSIVLVLFMALSVLPQAALARVVDDNGTTVLSSWFDRWWDIFFPRPDPKPSYPAQTMSYDSHGGTSVYVDAPEGALPADTALDVALINDLSNVQAAFDAASSERGHVYAALDINFLDQGKNEVEPRNPVTVTLENDVIADLEDLQLVHFKGSASELGSVEMEVIEDFYLSGTTITFEASDFSVYAVIGDGEEGERARLTVKFYNGETVIDTAYITPANVDLVGNIIPDPTVNQSEGDTKVFCGWIIGKPDYDSDDVLGDHTINYVRAAVVDRLTDTENPVQEGDVMKVYAMFFNYYIVSFLSENGDVTRFAEAVYTKENSLEYTIDQSYTPELDGYRFVGWQMVGTDTVYPNKTTITIMGDTTFRAKVQAGRWLIFEENPYNDDDHKGATYNPPVFCEDGVVTPAVKPADPTLPGYTFGGWYTDANFTTEFNFNQTIRANTTAYAKWTKNATAAYTILIWQQNLAGDGYDFVQSIKLIGNSDSAITTINPQGSGNSAYVRINGTNYSYTGFHYDHNDASGKTINCKGTTVVNVYFDRNEYTLTFQIPNTYTQSSNYGNWYKPSNSSTYYMLFYMGSDGNYYALDGSTSASTAYYYNGSNYVSVSNNRRYVVNTWKTADTITALYGQDISSEFPIDGAPEGVLWNPQNSTIFDSEHDVPALETMPAESTTFRMLYYGVEIDYNFYYYIEALPGTSNTVSYGGKNYTLHQTITIQGQPGVQSTKSEDMYDITGFTQGDAYPAYGTDGTVELTSTYDYSIKLYYTRNSYKILYQDGSYFDGNQIMIADGPDRGYLGESNDILYEDNITSYNKNGANYFKPAYSGYMFEGWYLDKTCTVAANFNKMPEGGVTVYAKWQRIQYRVFLHENDGTLPPGQDPDFRVDQGNMISNGEDVQITRDGYEFVGWYTDAEMKNSFNFNTKLYDNTDGMKDYPDSDRVNSDIPRYWVTGQLHLYAKWRYSLPGASGITILYNAVSYIQAPGNSIPGHYEGTTTEWTDPLPYTDGAYAIGRTASAPDSPDDYVFLYYEIMNADGTPSGKRVYPGQNFTVDYNDAVVSDVTPTGSKGVTGGMRAGEKYNEVSAPTAGKKYLLIYIANSTAYVVTTDYHDSDFGGRQPKISAITVSSNSDGTYSFSSSSYTLTDLLFTAEANGNYWRFKSVNASKGYLANAGGYVVYSGETTSSYTAVTDWTVSNGYFTSATTDSTYKYLYASTTYMDIDCDNSDSQASHFIFAELVENAASYTVTFKDWDGTVLSSEQVAEGGSATPPANPTREGYTFIGWSGNYTNVQQNETVTATYEKDATSGTEVWVPVTTIEPGEEYLIGRISSNGTVYLLMSYNPDASAAYYSGTYYYSYAIAAVRDSEGRVIGVSNDSIISGTMEHVKWVFTEVSGGYTIKGVYNNYLLRTSSSSYPNDLYPSSTTTVSVYNTWAWYNGRLRASIDSQYDRVIGTRINSDNQAVLYFQASTSSGVNLQLYKKEFIANVDTYTVKFYGWEGAELDSQTVEEGSCATAPADPTHTGYIFNGWAKDGDSTTLYTKAQVDAMPITADTTFTAHYTTESGNEVYTVTFVNWNGQILKTEYVEEGSGATAPAVPARENYTFTGWDTYAWENNVTEDLIVTANFQKTVTKQYTVTLRAVYGPKAVLEKTHITWHANNGTGDYKHSVDVLMNENIEIEYPEADPNSTGAKVDDLIWGEDDNLIWTDHVFLGWAKIAISDSATGSQVKPEYDPEDEAYVKERSFNEDDLFLKYVAPSDDSLHGTFYAKFEGEWTPVEYVAADELMPYNGMYAVWADVFYVYHSGTNEVEKIVRTTKAGETFDLANMTSEGYLYGGYYHDYLGKSDDFDAKALTYSAFSGADALNNGKWTNEQTDNGTGAKQYDGTNVTWSIDDAYKTTDEDAETGMAITPDAGTTYYIKEVPARQYLQPYLHYTYHLGYNDITNAWLISDIDDTNYLNTGFMIVDSNKKATVCNSLTVQNSNGGNSIRLTAKKVFRAQGVTGGLLTYREVINVSSGLNLLANGNSVLQFWVTPDGLLVTGNTCRIYNGLQSCDSIGYTLDSNNESLMMITDTFTPAD